MDEIEDWRIDETSGGDIEAILRRDVTDRVSPEFMAPPLKLPAEIIPIAV